MVFDALRTLHVRCIRLSILSLIHVQMLKVFHIISYTRTSVKGCPSICHTLTSVFFNHFHECTGTAQARCCWPLSGSYFISVRISDVETASDILPVELVPSQWNLLRENDHIRDLSLYASVRVTWAGGPGRYRSVWGVPRNSTCKNWNGENLMMTNACCFVLTLICQ